MPRRTRGHVGRNLRGAPGIGVPGSRAEDAGEGRWGGQTGVPRGRRATVRSAGVGRRRAGPGGRRALQGGGARCGGAGGRPREGAGLPRGGAGARAARGGGGTSREAWEAGAPDGGGGGLGRRRGRVRAGGPAPALALAGSARPPRRRGRAWPRPGRGLGVRGAAGRLPRRAGTHISNNYVVHLKLMFYVNYISI